MKVNREKLKQHATLIRNHRSTVQVTPATEFLAEYAWGPFAELAYGPTAEAAKERSIDVLLRRIETVAVKLDQIVAN